jgi:hypothetical protein
MSTGCPRGVVYEKPLFGNCDPQYTLVKTWGRDLCQCTEERWSVRGIIDRLSTWISANIKIVMLLIFGIGAIYIVVKILASKIPDLGNLYRWERY